MTLYLMDSDHISLIQRGGEEGQRIIRRLRDMPPDDVGTTIITYEEQMRGWLSRIAQASSSERQVVIYGELKRLLNRYCQLAVLEYDTAAAEQYERLRQEHRRLGTMDLKIAAIALTNNAIVLTRNATDFGKVNGLSTEDWSI